MAVAKLYGKFLEHLAEKRIDLTSDSLKLMLCSSAYVPNQDTHDYKDDVTNEVAAAGYTAGGQALTTVALTYDSATNTLKLTADPVSWTAVITARIAVLYDSTPASDATRPLIGYIDFQVDQASIGGVFVVPWADAGILTLAAA